MATNYTLANLIEDSLMVNDNTVVVYPQVREEHRLHVEELIPKFNGCFAVNNSTVSFIHEHKFFVTPYTRKGVEALRVAYFHERYFYVPFSNCDYPKYEQYRWNELRAKARRSYEEDFRNDCIAYCDERHVGELNEEILKNCFKIPREGVHVKHPSYETCVYPHITSEGLDCSVINKLGRFCTNNGKVVFVYRDGSTYVAKGYGVLKELQAAGYREVSMLFVPFSNGEQILDPVLHQQWEGIKTFK